MTNTRHSRLSVYVDETGDRGLTAKSSPFFAMTALMVPAEDDWNVITTAAPHAAGFSATA